MRRIGIPNRPTVLLCDEWFAGRIDDREATDRMAAAFARLGDLWRKGAEARGGDENAADR